MLVAVSVLAVLSLQESATPTLLAAEADCGLLQDCTFDNFYGNAGAGSGPWKVFKLAGTSGFSLAPWEGWPDGPSVKVSSEGGFDAGIYQQVAVTPGTAYRFSIPFAVIDINGQGWQEGVQVNRKMGIDPYGGTDANSGGITWSADYFGRGKFNDDELQVSAYARAATITVFIRIGDPYTDRHVDVFLDSPTLQVNADIPPIEIAAPTATPPPPPPTNTPRPTPRPTQIPSPEAEATTKDSTGTDASTETPEITSTKDGVVALEPSETPTRLPSRSRRATITPTPQVETGTSSRVLALTVGGAVALGGVVAGGALLGLAFVYWRRSKS